MTKDFPASADLITFIEIGSAAFLMKITWIGNKQSSIEHKQPQLLKGEGLFPQIGKSLLEGQRKELVGLS